MYYTHGCHSESYPSQPLHTTPSAYSLELSSRIMADQQAQPREPRQAQGGSMVQKLLRMGLMYVVITAVMNYFKQPQQSNNVQKYSSIDSIEGVAVDKPNQFQTMMMGVSPDAKLPSFPQVDSNGKRIGTHKCLFEKGISLDFHLYVTEEYIFDSERDASKLVWNREAIPYDYASITSPSMNINISVSEHMLSSGQVYAHVFFSRDGSPIDADHMGYNPDAVAYQRFPLVRLRKKKIPKKTYKLLDAPSEDQLAADQKEEEMAADGQMVPYWVPTLDVALVVDMPKAFGRNAIPAPILQHLQFNSEGDYFPVVYHNDFFLMSKSLIEINSSTEELPLAVSIGHMSFWRWHMQSQMEQQWRAQEAMGTGSERDTDMIREVIFDTNPWLLGLTFAVSLLHTVFDFLAFKNDVQFWRKKKSMAGMSVQSLGVNCFFQTVIFLYLMDNDTSWMILFSSGIGLCIEFWKLGKAFNVSFARPSPPNTPTSGAVVPAKGMTSVSSILGVPLPFSLSWRLSESYTTSKTREYDAIATSHLLYAVVPLVVGYSAYSLIHISHKSFYSWFLGSLVGFVYAFGFVLMTPQLFINYKLKSVAHMPWKAMVYKSLNTFIDDLFAFIIKMPLMHRLACFRDDIIFFIYLYQRWIYAVDMTRVNEFGQGGTEDDDDTVQNDIKQPVEDSKPEHSTPSNSQNNDN